MRRLTLIALAASALTISGAALAQSAGHAGPRAASGHTFGHGGSNVTIRHHGSVNSVAGGRSGAMVRHGRPNVVVRHGGPNVRVRHSGFGHPGPNFRHHRLRRGGFIHPFWFGPQFHVQDWQLYGFSAPPRDHRWVRYYDDAYLIDREGRVQDTRYGLDWDEYGERWDSDAGIPSYYGRGDFHPDESDYAWVESQEGPGYAEGPGFGEYDEGYAEEGYAAEDYGPRDDAYTYGYPSPAPACRPMPPSPCGGHGYGYGAGYGYYGWGYAYPIVIETTVVTGGTSYVEEVTEEVVEVRQAQRRHHRPAPRQRPRPPRPPAGERG